MLQGTGQPGLFTIQLLEAILAGDNDRLHLLLAAASPEQLEDIASACPYHAAAMAGNDKAVTLLASDGVPISAADEQCCGTVLASFTGMEAIQQQLAGWSLTALAVAAWRGHADVVAALLGAGASTEAVSLDASSQPSRQLTPLVVVADCPHRESGEAVALLLLEAGADVAAVSEADVQRCAEMCPAVGSLLAATQQETSCAAGGSEAGSSDAQGEGQSGEVRQSADCGSGFLNRSMQHVRQEWSAGSAS